MNEEIHIRIGNHIVKDMKYYSIMFDLNNNPILYYQKLKIVQPWYIHIDHFEDGAKNENK